MTQEDELWDLQRLAAARGLGDWMFDQYADRVGSDVVEVGAGIGTFTERLLARGAARVLAIEPEPACAAVLARRFGDDARVTVARELLPGLSRPRCAGGNSRPRALPERPGTHQ